MTSDCCFESIILNITINCRWKLNLVIRRVDTGDDNSDERDDKRHKDGEENYYAKFVFIDEKQVLRLLTHTRIVFSIVSFYFTL